MLRVGIVILILNCISILNAGLPSYITKCKRSDPNLSACLTEQASNALEQLLKGDASVGVKPVQSVTFPKVYIKPTNTDFGFEIKDSVAYGWATAIIQDLSMDFKKQTLQMQFKGPHWQWEGVYNAFGQLNNSSYDHNGTWNVTFENTTGVFNAEYEPSNIDGYFYMQLKNEVFAFNTDKLAFNLTSPESRYSKEVNDLMDMFNDKHSDLHKELLPTIKVVSAEILATLINKILRSVTMCKLFDD